MKELNLELQKLFGIQTYKYKAAFSHVYFVNSFANIIAQVVGLHLVQLRPSAYPKGQPELIVGHCRETLSSKNTFDRDDLRCLFASEK
ncbi:hypothetical protein PQX77_015620 [Marasmius sp. AFHP31]|nr:hypothetical protein PQX77_015620 [Marasmius sp. AFHP31]